MGIAIPSPGSRIFPLPSLPGPLRSLWSSGTRVERDEYRVVGVGGTPLEVVVYRPAHPAEPTARSHPVVVLPTSWGSPPTGYTLFLEWLADSGYLAVAYTPRGFLRSGGRIEAASPRDVGDFGAVLDWVLEEFPIADPGRVAAVGLSYGAGISLLAAAKDSRVKTVVAVDGWADLSEAVNPGDTPRLSAGLLVDGGMLGESPRRPSSKRWSTTTAAVTSSGSDAGPRSAPPHRSSTRSTPVRSPSCSPPAGTTPCSVPSRPSSSTIG